MNREILFRAKTTKKNNPNHEFNEKWVEGNLILCGDKAYIHPASNKIDVTGEIGRIIVMHEVDPETLCQYTGLTDKNGEKIWENDIAHIRSSGLSGYGVVKYQNGNLVLVDEKRKRTYSLYGEWKIRKDGNIFDNPDLLEVK